MMCNVLSCLRLWLVMSGWILPLLIGMIWCRAGP